jgi:hypothetical protein
VTDPQAPEIETEVKTTITLRCLTVATLHVNFATRDIGCTQGTTLHRGGHLLAQYRPGTKHPASALEIAVDALKAAYAACIIKTGTWELRQLRDALADALRDTYARPWDGEDIEWGGPDDVDTGAVSS